nr:MAG TPA: hypothetical protein [Bacteriophage sp.]
MYASNLITSMIAYISKNFNFPSTNEKRIIKFAFAYEN